MGTAVGVLAAGLKNAMDVPWFGGLLRELCWRGHDYGSTKYGVFRSYCEFAGMRKVVICGWYPKESESGGYSSNV